MMYSQMTLVRVTIGIPIRNVTRPLLRSPDRPVEPPAGFARAPYTLEKARSPRRMPTCMTAPPVTR